MKKILLLLLKPLNFQWFSWPLIIKEVKTLKIAPFTLNGASLLKKKIKLMDNPYQIEVKDQGKQCTINMSTTTYHIIMNNIVPIGERVGLKMVKPLDVDNSGKALKSQYECQLLSYS